MASRIEVTENELLDSIAAALPTAPKNALTCKELCEATGVSRHYVTKFLGSLAMQDRLGVHRAVRRNVAGYSKGEPAYTILPPKKRKP